MLYLFMFVNFMIFMIVFSMPVYLYSSIMHENDYSHLDVLSLLFILACDAALLFGYHAYKPVVFSHGVTYKPRAANNLYLFFLLVPILILVLVSFYILLEHFPDLLSSLGSIEAQQMRANVSTIKNSMSGAPVLLTGIIWWAIYKLRYTETTFSRKLLFSRAIIFSSVIIVTIYFVVKLSRMELVPLYFGIFMVYNFSANKMTSNRSNIFLKNILLIGIFGVGIFVLLSWVRGYNLDTVIKQFFAYLPASYNRLSALLNGSLHFAGERSGIYVSSFQGQIPIIKSFVNIYSFLGQPTLDYAWRHDFSDVANAGLNAHYTFPTIYGSIFTFCGYLSPIYFFLFGAVIKQFYSSFARGKIFGIIFYPLSLFCIMFSFGWNFFLSYEFIVMIIAVFYIFIFEKLIWPILARRSYG